MSNFYYENVANKLPRGLTEKQVLDQAFDIVAKDFGAKRARALLVYNEDFAGDMVSHYFLIERQ